MYLEARQSHEGRDHNGEIPLRRKLQGKSNKPCHLLGEVNLLAMAPDQRPPSIQGLNVPVSRIRVTMWVLRVAWLAMAVAANCFAATVYLAIPGARPLLAGWQINVSVFLNQLTSCAKQ